MADQTEMRPGNGSPESPPGLVHGVGEVAEDVAALAELQLNLLKAEAQIGARRVAVCGLLGSAALLVLAGCVPVALISVAFWLMQAARLSSAAGFAWAALAGAALAAVLAGTAWLVWRTSPLTFALTRKEFARNLKWIKTVLRG